jgi:Nuclease-related domain
VGRLTDITLTQAGTELASKRHEHERACHCKQADANCSALAVRRLSQERVHELAEEIWAASTEAVVPVHPTPDPRTSQPGASAQAAYRRRRQQERETWRQGRWWRRMGTAAAVTGGAALLVGITFGAWLGWQAALVMALLAAWRLRFRPSPGAIVWRRQAALQRRAAGVLRPLEQEGHLVLHDIALPGWPASLDHLVIGPTGVWAIDSWQNSWLRRRRKLTAPWRADPAAAGPLRELRWKAAAVADVLAGTGVHVAPLLCVHGGMRPGGDRAVEGIRLTTLRQLPELVRRGSRLQPGKVEQATARALEVLRPAA